MLIFVPNFPLMTYYDKVFYREITLVPLSFLPVIAECLLLLSTLKYSVTEGSMEAWRDILPVVLGMVYRH